MPARIKDDDDVLELHRLYVEDGMALLDLAVEFGIPEATIREHFHRLSLPLRRAGAQAGKPHGRQANERAAEGDPLGMPRAKPVGPKATHRRRGFKV